MGHRAATLALLIGALAVQACGDTLVIVGDSPGIMRVVAGIPDQAGDSIGDRATESQLQDPLGLAADERGFLFIADNTNGRILSVSSAGEIAVLIDREQEARLREPEGLALDPEAGTLVITDPRGHRVWRLDLAIGSAEPVAGTGVRGSTADTIDAAAASLDTPRGVALASDGSVFFSEFGNNRIRRIEPDGSLVTFAGTGEPGLSGDGGPALEAKFLRPAGLAVGAGVLYVADSGNHAVRAIDLGTRTIETVAGSGVRGFGGDRGPAVEARLDTPWSVAITSDGGTLFIADSRNARVRSVNLDTGVITTFAGTGSDSFNGELMAAGETALSGPRAVTVSPFDFLFISDTGHHLVWRVPVGVLVTGRAVARLDTTTSAR